MESKAKLLGHSLHPMLIVFPLGLLGGSVIFEIVYYITGANTYSLVTYWMMVSGLIGGVVAAVFGFIDFTAIPAGTRARALLGVPFALLAGWLGGELIERLGVGVHEGANLDASSSLSSEKVSIAGTEFRKV